MPQSYHLGNIRALLTEGFTDQELRTLSFDVPGFRPVYHQLAQNSGKTEIISRLLEHAERTTQLDQLLELAKAHNPNRYAEHEPYFYEDSATTSPYRGLQYFDVNHANLFFGREQLTAKLVARLTPSPALSLKGGESRFLAIVGASGSGKSSLVRAGLVPALRRGPPLALRNPPPENNVRWSIHIITPTAHPLEALAASLTRHSESVTATATLIDDMSKDCRSLHLYIRRIFSQPSSHPPTPLLLIVDQFEELFTLCRHEGERRSFVDNLLMAVDPQTDGPVLVILALRADFYAHCAQYDNLREALAQHQEYIGPMSAEELRRAIELPAQQVGYEFEAGLVDLLLRDVGDEPGAMPLLSHALLETWKRRKGRLLTLAGYAESGGVRGAIAQTAETVFNQHLTAEQQPIARSIFLRLTELGEGAQDTRRRAALAELSSRPEEQAAVEAVLQTLVEARLVTTDQSTAEVAHEALIREWPTLRHWLDENREGLRLHHQLSEAAKEWNQLNRDAGALYRGARLGQASEWAEQHLTELNTLERQFLTASKQAEENEQQRELAQARALAEEQQRRAEVEQQRAEEQRQAAARLKQRALLATAIGVIAIMAAMTAAFFGWQASENAKLAATREAEARQQEAVAREQANRANAHRLAAEGELQFEEKPLLGLRLALEGWTLSSAYSQIDQNIHGMAQRGRLLTLGQGDVEAIHTSDYHAAVFLVDLANAPGELRRTADATLVATMSGPVEYGGVTFSPDETASYFVVHYSDDTPGELRRTADGQVITTLSGPLRLVIFSPDEAGTYFVVHYSDDTPGELRRTADGQVIATLSGPINFGDVTFSPDEAGTYFVVHYSDDTPGELRRTADGRVITTLSDSISGVTFSPDETASYFVVQYYDDTLSELRRTADGKVITTLSGSIYAVNFSPDEAASYFVVNYGGIIPTELRRTADGDVVSLSGPVADVTFSPDETASYFVVHYSDDTPTELRRTAEGDVVSLSGSVAGVTFSPDKAGSYLIIGYNDVTPAELRRTSDGVLVATLAGPVAGVTFSLDEAASFFVVSYSDDTPSELRRSADGTVIKTLSGPVAVHLGLTTRAFSPSETASYFSPDEAVSYFIVGYTNTPGELRRTADGQTVATLSGPVAGVTFSPDEAASYFLVNYSDDTPSELRRSADGQVIANRYGWILTVDFISDKAGTYFVVTYRNGQRELWQVQGEPRRLTELGLGLEQYHFDLTSNRFIIRYSDGRAYLLDLAWLGKMGGLAAKMPIEELVRLACEGPFAGELFDEAELQLYLGEQQPQACKE